MTTQTGEMMQLRSVVLRDWKGYAGENTFEFPKASRNRNVVLLGAVNGYGKTSFLEALMLGIYGKDAIDLVGRADLRSPDEDRTGGGYNDFLERALHKRALDEGRSSMSVKVVFEDDGDRLSINRVWHFQTNGRHRPDQEQILVELGAERELAKPTRFEDKDDFYRGIIAQRFLPVYLARFFLFDGERVQYLAQREMSTQVRLGIEGLLGVALLRTLMKDLETYEDQRRRDVSGAGDDTLQQLRAKVDEVDARVRGREAELSEILRLLTPLEDRHQALLANMRSISAGSNSNLKELHEQKGQLQRERDRRRDQLAALLMSDLALAIAGRALRDRVRGQLAAEQLRARWEAGKSESEGLLGRFLEELHAPPPPLTPALTDDQSGQLKGRVRTAWEAMWYPQPTGCAEYYRHRYLSEEDRALIKQRLDRLDQMSLGALEEVLHQLDQFERDLGKVNDQLSRLEGIDEPLRKIGEELDRVSKEHREYGTRKETIERQLTSERDELANARATLQRENANHAKARPKLAKLNMAERARTVIAEVIEESFGNYTDDVAAQMTDIYKRMAHKGQVARVAIDKDCSVTLVGKSGADLRELDASAGENQVFAFALIAAIAQASGRSFPIIIDTPLARLDSRHRINILKWFTERAGEQIILLSQDAEVTGQYLDVIRDRVNQTFLLEHEELGHGVGVNHVRKGQYFERV